jgi:hypothetical protein
MASILDFYTDNTDNISRIVDTTYSLLLRDQTSELATIAPVVDYLDPGLLIMKFNHSKPTIASLVGNEQELPVQRTRVTLSEDLLQEARIGKQYVFKNEDFKAMRKLEMAMRDRNLSGPMITEFKNLFFGYAGDLPTSIIEKLTLILMSVLCTGGVDYDDPLTKAKFNLSYPDIVTSGVNQLMFTAPPLVADSWDTPATAAGLLQLELHARAWNLTFGSWPQRLVMRSSLFLSLLTQTSTRQAIASTRAFTATAGDLASLYVPDSELINQLKLRTKVTEVILLDAMYSVESSAGIVSDLFFMPSNSYFFSESGNAQRAFVPTPEKDFAAGIYVNWKQLDDAPRKERIVGVGAGIPAIFDSRKLAARRVLISA